MNELTTIVSTELPTLTVDTIVNLDDMNSFMLNDSKFTVYPTNCGIRIESDECKYAMSVITFALFSDPSAPYEIAVLDPIGGLLDEVPADIAAAATDSTIEDSYDWDVIKGLTGTNVINALTAMSRHKKAVLGINDLTHKICISSM